jgi:hypothetical protein
MMESNSPLVGAPKDMNKPLFGEESNKMKIIYIAVALVTTGMVLFTFVSAFVWTSNGLKAQNVFFAFVLLLLVAPLVVVVRTVKD